jgi:putative FmdB family regulatory protein
MPSYEYACGDCGSFDAIQSLAFWDRPVECPGCGALAPRALASPQRAFKATDTTKAPRSAAHASGCGCCSTGRRTKPKAPVAPPTPSFLTRG